MPTLFVGPPFVLGSAVALGLLEREDKRLASPMQR
jgi:hypothetical protein